MPKNVLNRLKSISIEMLNSRKGSFGAMNVRFIMAQVLAASEKWDKDRIIAQTKNKEASLMG
jgi:hypothetical protein